MANNAGQKSMWLRQAVFESVLILVGIVLGFWVNEWREDIEKAARGEAALARIIEEVQDNRKSVQAIMPYHAEILENLVKLDGNLPDAPMVDTFLELAAYDGVGDLLLQDEAWRIATARDSLITIDFNIVQQIASTYNLANFGTKNTWTAIIDMFNDKDVFVPESAAYMHKRYIFAYSNLVSQEKYLIDRYDALLEQLNERATP